jgi:anti-sigma regulatory factor (Ser/Thr protein kinase)
VPTDGHVDVELTLPAGEASPGRARAAVGTWLSAHVDESMLEDALLLVSELVTNSVRHARAPRDAQITVRAWRRGAGFRFEVRDAGRQGAVRVRDRAGDEIGGYGLALVAALASAWGVKRAGGTTVWFELETRAS